MRSLSPSALTAFTANVYKLGSKITEAVQSVVATTPLREATPSTLVIRLISTFVPVLDSRDSCYLLLPCIFRCCMLPPLVAFLLPLGVFWPVKSVRDSEPSLT
jgi:hypothetical protein